MNLNLKNPIAFFDLETTGINTVSDRIVELSILKINPNGSEESLTMRLNPEMTIPLSTLRILVDNKRELFMTSFTVTTIGNKKIQLPIKLPIKTRSNSAAKLLALLTLSKNVFLTGTYQTDQQGKIKNLIETFDSVFDVNLCPDGEIAQQLNNLLEDI